MAHTTSAAMIRTVALLALIASVSAIWPFDHQPWKSGFSHTFDLNPFSSTSFVSLPRTMAQAEEEGWEAVQGPATPEGYEDLTLMMKPSEPTTGLYFDTIYVAGVLIALPVDQITPYYNTTQQGLKLWSRSINGEIKEYLTSCFFFVTEDLSTRVYDENEVVQANTLNFVSIDGKMDTISKKLTDIKEDASSVWKEQGCMIWMGLHYYHSMTESTACDTPFVTYFGLFDDKTNQLIGIGFMVLGECKAVETCEDPSVAAVKMIVNHGPQCLYDLVEKYGACTHHFYFVDQPTAIVC